METEWDEAKNEANKRAHRLDFGDFVGFDSDPTTWVDSRYNYGEVRFIAIGRIEGLPHTIVYTQRGGKMQLISWRRAREKEFSNALRDR